MNPRLGACLLALVFTPSAHAQWTWTIAEVNPNQSSTDADDPNGASGGRVNGLARADALTFYAASEWGGLFKTTDGGQRWTHLRGHVPHATWDVEVDPGDPRRVYATSFYDGRVSSLAGISISTDHGATWSRPASATPPAGRCADPARRQQPSAFGIAVDPENPARVVVGTNCGVAISMDRGATWRFVDPTPGDGGAEDVWDVAVHHGGIIDTCGDDSHQRSTDNGATWTSATGQDLPAGRCSIAASPDEADVLFAVSGTSIRESDDGGRTWSAPFTPGMAQGRIPFVAVNQRSGAAFDLYFGDTELFRTSCSTPAAPGAGRRCPTGAWSNVQEGSHWDVGDLAFAPSTTPDPCPALFSNDGGVYRNTKTASPGCHDPNWEQATVSTAALWLFGMAGTDQAGVDTESLYLGNQDDGSFATKDVPVASRTWINPDCCDTHDVAAEGNRVVYTSCCYNAGRANRVFVRGSGMTGGGELNRYPPGEVEGFSQGDSIARFAPNSYALLTASGVFVTSNIGATPVSWTALGAGTRPAGARHLQAAVAGGTPSFYVQAGEATGHSRDRLFRYTGTAPGGTWTRVRPPADAGGFGIVAVDPNNPNRLIASHLREGLSPRMLRSTNGGATWTVMTALNAMMTGNGTFRYANTRGPAAQLPMTAEMDFTGYSQPTLVSFSPADPQIVAAGGVDSGVFLSFDGGTTWTLLTDPLTPGTSGRAHIPRPRYVYFDDEGGSATRRRLNLYVGTQGRGAWRIALERPLP